MAFGVKIFGATGALTFDSTTALGGVFVEVITVAPTASTVTKTYPVFAGRAVTIQPVQYQGVQGAVVDSTLGYPRVVVSAVAAGQPNRRFAVLVE